MFYMVRADPQSAETLRTAEAAGQRQIQVGDRVLLYELRGEGPAARGSFFAWGAVDRAGSGGDDGPAVSLRPLVSFKRRVPFADLRADPRRGREADVLTITAELFNQVIARSHRG